MSTAIPTMMTHKERHDVLDAALECDDALAELVRLEARFLAELAARRTTLTTRRERLLRCVVTGTSPTAPEQLALGVDVAPKPATPVAPATTEPAGEDGHPEPEPPKGKGTKSGSRKPSSATAGEKRAEKKSSGRLAAARSAIHGEAPADWKAAFAPSSAVAQADVLPAPGVPCCTCTHSIVDHDNGEGACLRCECRGFKGQPEDLPGAPGWQVRPAPGLRTERARILMGEGKETLPLWWVPKYGLAFQDGKAVNSVFSYLGMRATTLAYEKNKHWNWVPREVLRALAEHLGATWPEEQAEATPEFDDPFTTRATDGKADPAFKAVDLTTLNAVLGQPSQGYHRTYSVRVKGNSPRACEACGTRERPRAWIDFTCEDRKGTKRGTYDGGRGFGMALCLDDCTVVGVKRGWDNRSRDGAKRQQWREARERRAGDDDLDSVEAEVDGPGGEHETEQGGRDTCTATHPKTGVRCVYVPDHQSGWHHGPNGADGSSGKRWKNDAYVYQERSAAVPPVDPAHFDADGTAQVKPDAPAGERVICEACNHAHAASPDHCDYTPGGEQCACRHFVPGTAQLAFIGVDARELLLPHVDVPEGHKVRHAEGSVSPGAAGKCEACGAAPTALLTLHVTFNGKSMMGTSVNARVCAGCCTPEGVAKAQSNREAGWKRAAEERAPDEDSTSNEDSPRCEATGPRPSGGRVRCALLAGHLGVHGDGVSFRWDDETATSEAEPPKDATGNPWPAVDEARFPGWYVHVIPGFNASPGEPRKAFLWVDVKGPNDSEVEDLYWFPAAEGGPRVLVGKLTEPDIALDTIFPPGLYASLVEYLTAHWPIPEELKRLPESSPEKPAKKSPAKGSRKKKASPTPETPPATAELALEPPSPAAPAESSSRETATTEPGTWRVELPEKHTGTVMHILLVWLVNDATGERKAAQWWPSLGKLKCSHHRAGALRGKAQEEHLALMGWWAANRDEVVAPLEAKCAAGKVPGAKCAAGKVPGLKVFAPELLAPGPHRYALTAPWMVEVWESSAEGSARARFTRPAEHSDMAWASGDFTLKDGMLTTADVPSVEWVAEHLFVVQEAETFVSRGLVPELLGAPS